MMPMMLIHGPYFEMQDSEFLEAGIILYKLSSVPGL